MLKRVIATVCAALVMGVVSIAQAPVNPPSLKPEAPGQSVNVRIEVTIADQACPGDPTRKSASLVVADRAAGSIRNAGTPRGVLNVDARPAVTGSSVRLTLGLEYNPRISATAEQPLREFSSLSEQITVVLESGKPLVVSQAADPTSDRKVAVEVRATIVK